MRYSKNSKSKQKISHKINALSISTLFALGLTISSNINADQVFLDDIIVDGSACVGFDCVNGESFGFDTIRLKENNLRIKFVDTSSSASFPSNDWQITINDSSNGGANKFSIDDVDGGRTPFTIEAGAPSHSLFVEDSGDIGIGTNNPVVELHIVDGDTPTLRLQQDGSSGFGPQTWDVAGNETNFFVRDATNGSTLPFRIRPGAPSSSIYIDVDGDVGLGTASPDAKLDVAGSAVIGVAGNDPVHSLTVNGPVLRQIAYATGNGPEDSTNSGQIVSRVLTVNKLRDDTVLRIGYTDNLRALGADKACRWEAKVDGVSCNQPLIYDYYNPNLGESNDHRSYGVLGYCSGVLLGSREIQIWVDNVPGYVGSNCYTGWSNSTWVVEVEEIAEIN